jgi:hypothetical protein
MKATVLALALFIGTTGCSRQKEGQSEKKAILARLEAAESVVLERTRGFEAAMADRASVVSGSTPCPAVASRPAPATGSPEAELADRLARMQTALSAGWGRSVVVRRDPAGVKPPSVAALERRAAEVRKKLEGRSGLEPLKREVDELASPKFWRHDIVVVVSDSARASVDVEGKSFEPGTVVGRSYLYDYEKGMIVCAGQFAATNAAEVEYAAPPEKRYGAAASAVANDLEAQAMKAGTEALRAIE